MKPMLACAYQEGKLVLPGYVQPKLDGIRAVVKDGQLYSRSLKLIPNLYIQEKLKGLEEGLDGELIVGNPADSSVYNKTQSAVMTVEGEPDFTFYVFDKQIVKMAYVGRQHLIEGILENYANANIFPHVKTTPCVGPLGTLEEIMQEVDNMMVEGYEGAIYRFAEGLYKQGRSTANQSYLVKFKQFVDDEAEIVDFGELDSNQNVATINELGYTARSSHKENKIPMNTLGYLVVNWGDITLKIGTGFDQEMRQHIWDNRENYRGKIVKFKYSPHGMKDRPRHPVFLGFRSPEDM